MIMMMWMRMVMMMVMMWMRMVMMMSPPICNGLCLHIVGVHCYQWYRALFSGPTCCVGSVPYSAAGKYCTQGVRIKGNWLVLPVKKVCTSSMAPVHRTPHCVVRVVLVEKVVLATPVDKAIGVVDPTCFWGKVELWAPLLLIISWGSSGCRSLVQGAGLTEGVDWNIGSAANDTLVNTMTRKVVPHSVVVFRCINVDAVFALLIRGVVCTSIIWLSMVPVKVYCLIA